MDPTARRFRIYLWRDGGFWRSPQYSNGDTSATVRARLAREWGEEVARKSSVTAICDVTPGLNPNFSGVRPGPVTL